MSADGGYGWVAPRIANGRVLNAHEVTLHRGKAGIRFKTDNPYGDFDSHLDGLVSPQKDSGVSVSVLAGDSNETLLQQAHEELAKACRHRLLQMIHEYCATVLEKDEDMGKSLKAQVKKITRDRKKPYSTLLDDLKTVSQLNSLEKPFCYVKVVNPWYNWAQLVSKPTEVNAHHYLLELVETAHVDTINAMAECQDDGWTPCPHMMKATAKPHDELHHFEFSRKGATGITCAAWEALDYLLQEFSDGSCSLNVQEAFEICWYRSQISHGLQFQQKRYSGLQTYARLAAFLELALHMDYWIDHEETRLIVEHDMLQALQNDNGARIVKSSFVAFFDSGAHAHLAQVRPVQHELSVEGLSFLTRLLRSRDIGHVCEELRNKIRLMLKQGEEDFQWDTLKLGSLEYDEVFTDATLIAGILDRRLIVQPVIVDGSATFMVPLISAEISQQLKRSIMRSEDVQQAFAVTMEIHLLVSLGVPKDRKDPYERASRFITGMEAVVDDPRNLYLRTRTPTVDDIVTIGVIRFRRPLSTPEGQEIGISMHNLLHTMNSAVWRIPSRHRVWCTSKDYGFNMTQAILGNRTNGNTQQKLDADKWATTVIDISREKLVQTNLVVSAESEIRAATPMMESFIILVTWNDTLCRRAMSAFENEGLKAFDNNKIDYRTQWTIDMKTKQIIDYS